MKISKRLMLPMAAIAMLGATAAGVGIVSAATDTKTGSLAEKIASSFNLDPAKVQAVIDQNHEERHQKHAANYGARLTQAVADGELTEAQKQSILAKHNELKSKLEAAKDQGQSKSERRALMDQTHQEAQDWAKQNNIDEKWLIPGSSHKHGGMSGHHHDDKSHDDGATPSSSPSASPGV